MTEGNVSSSADRSAIEIERLFRSISHPFPYDECRYLIKQRPEAGGALIPDLDLYFSTIAGYASSATSLARWSANRLAQARADLASSFFEQRPQYSELLAYVDTVATPSLFARLEAYEAIRVGLLELLRELQPSSHKDEGA
jgi:hypothetical protein